MAVALDTAGTQNGTTTSTLVTSFNYTGITVGSGADRALIFACAINGGASHPTGVTATWDNGASNQAMTQLVHIVDSSTGDDLYIFGLRNPIAGNKTLRLAWTNANNVWCNAIAFTGVDQVSDASAFPNTGSGAGNSPTAPSVAVSSDANSYCVGVFQTAENLSSPSDTQLYDSAAGFLADSNSLAQYGVGAATKTMTTAITNFAASHWSAGAVSIAPVSAAGPTPYNPWPQMAPILAQ